MKKLDKIREFVNYSDKLASVGIEDCAQFLGYHHNYIDYLSNLLNVNRTILYDLAKIAIEGLFPKLHLRLTIHSHLEKLDEDMMRNIKGLKKDPNDDKIYYSTESRIDLDKNIKTYRSLFSIIKDNDTGDIIYEFKNDFELINDLYNQYKNNQPYILDNITKVEIDVYNTLFLTEMFKHWEKENEIDLILGKVKVNLEDLNSKYYTLLMDNEKHIDEDWHSIRDNHVAKDIITCLIGDDEYLETERGYDLYFIEDLHSEIVNCMIHTYGSAYLFEKIICSDSEANDIFLLNILNQL